jgi:hypothetical protein
VSVILTYLMFDVKHIYAGGDELFYRKCEVKVCDIIQLFLAGYDDKIYLNLSDTDENYILYNERIISSKWIPYYECNILYFVDDCGF